MRGAIGPFSQERVNTLIHCEYCVLKDLMANNLIVSTMGPLITEELSAHKLKWVGNLLYVPIRDFYQLPKYW